MRDPYKGYRLSKSVIGFAVRYYYRYKISLRDLSEMLEDRGLSGTYKRYEIGAKPGGLFMTEGFVKKGDQLLKINGISMK